MVKKGQAKKREWRKSKAADEVEEALEDERRLDRVRAKGDVFSVDTKGSEKHLSRAARREIARARLFPAKGPRVGLSASEQLKVDRAARAAALPPQKKKVSDPEVFDLWEAPDPAKAKAVAGPVLRDLPRLPPQKVPKTVGKPLGVAPAVLPAYEGLSLNPEERALEDVTMRAVAVQLEKEREEKELFRRRNPMLAALQDAYGEEAVRSLDEEEKMEMYQALTDAKAASAGDEEGEGADGLGSRGPVKNKKKSQQIRRRQKRRTIAEYITAQRKQQKKLDNSIANIEAVAKEVSGKELLDQERRDLKVSRKREALDREAKEGVVSKKRRIGKSVFEEEAIILPDAEAAKKGLRATPLQAGGALKDRISSIYRRGMLQTQPEAGKAELRRQKSRAHRKKASKKFISPLMREYHKFGKIGVSGV